MECFQAISVDKDCRAVVVSGAGKMFTSGIYNIKVKAYIILI